MPALNKVVLAGHVIRDPEVRYTSAGRPVADFGLQVSRPGAEPDGAKDEICLVSVSVWGRDAEMCGERLNKGEPVLVEGALQSDQWLNGQGEKRSRLRVRADRIQFLGMICRIEAGLKETG